MLILKANKLWVCALVSDTAKKLHGKGIKELPPESTRRDPRLVMETKKISVRYDSGIGCESTHPANLTGGQTNGWLL
jgi:hypothetical protein